ncbi:head-tail connector protein [Sphingopyxis sp. R3-92]|uniref:head-tail connector protein n=1 Tax=Sphingopyxis sp. R3-92 TaxID=3158553 RepID=UPI003EE5DEE6
MGATSLLPGDAPVSLNEARDWLRMGAATDDAIVTGLILAATGICEAFVGAWLMIRDVEEVLTLRGGSVRLSARPVVTIGTVTLPGPEEMATVVEAGAYCLRRDRDGTGRLAIDRAGDGAQLRVAYRAGIAEDAGAVPEAIRHGILRMVRHLHDARDGEGAPPPAAIAALWHPWRQITLGGAR